ncbi:MAG: HlyD family secretion protein [Rubrivivax sp.]
MPDPLSHPCGTLPQLAPRLFREEALRARDTQWLGTIRIGRPLSFRLATAATLAMAVALVSYSVWGQYTRKVTLPGALVPEGGVMDVSSPQPGIVAEVMVREGDAVQAGQPLVRIAAERQLASGELGRLQAESIAQRRLSLQAELRLADQQVQHRSTALADRIRSLQLDLAQLQGEREAVRQRVRLASATATRFDELAAQGFVPALQAQQRHEELIDLQLRERNAARQLEATARERASVQAELQTTQMQFASARAQLERQLAGLEQEGSELQARSGWLLTAPRAGRVSALAAAMGQSVNPGAALVSLLPADPAAARLTAHLYAPSRMAGFVEAGQEVWLRYAAYPYQKFGMHAGRVSGVSRTPVNPQDLPTGRAQALLAATQSQEPLYRISVELPSQSIMTYGKEQPLKAGMSLEAQIRQGERAIWEWVLEPLLSIWGSRPREGKGLADREVRN